MSEFELELMALIRRVNAQYNGGGAHQYDLVTPEMAENLGDMTLVANEVVDRIRPILVSLESRGYLTLVQNCTNTWRPVDLLTQIVMELD